MQKPIKSPPVAISALNLSLGVCLIIITLLYFPLDFFSNTLLDSSIPSAESYELINKLRLAFVIAIIPTIIFVFLVIRHFWGQITKPLIDFKEHIEQLPSKTGSDRLFCGSTVKEVAILGNAFNKLINQLDRDQEEIEKREQIFRTVTEFSTDLCFWLNPDRKTILYITPSCERITGYTDEEFYRDAELLDRIIHPDFRQLWDQHKNYEGKSEILDPIQLAIIARDGSTVWVNHVCKPVYDDKSVFKGTRGSFDDVTVIKKSMMALQTSEEKLNRQNDYLLAVHETALGVIGRLDVNNLLKDIVTRAAKLMNTEHGFIYLLNSSKTEMILQVKNGYYEKLDVPPLKRGQGIGGHVWETGKPFVTKDYSTWEKGFKHPGYEKIKATFGIPLTSAGRTTGVIGLAYLDEQQEFDNDKIETMQKFAELASIAIDNARLYESAQKELMERKKAEISLHKLTYAVEQSPVSIIITDIRGNIEYVNPHFAEVTGYTSNELLGQNPRILKSGFTSDAEYKKMWNTLMAGNVWHGEFRNTKKNGDVYWELAQISPIRDKGNVITNFIAIKEDIDDRKTLENQLRHSQKMEAIGQLAGGIAHDFNNILTAIIGYASIMQMKLPSGSPLKETAVHILSAAERGSSLTQGLLAFSRKQDTNLTNINLNDIIERIKKLLLRLIGEDIKLISILDVDTLPVLVDSVQIEQVLMNLVTNSRDAMPDGGSIVIKTEAIKIDDEFIHEQGFGTPGIFALLSVTDTGEGMDDETIKRIFDPFYTTKETGKGTGLGLSIIYGIIKKHNGYISCTSTPGKGATFNIYLPFTTSDNERFESMEPESTYTGGSEMILLAEDDDSMRSLYTELLEEFGYSIIAAKDGLEALELFRDKYQNISLAILDVIMPGMGGVETYKAMQTIKPGINVLFCSGYPAETIEKELIGSNNIHFLAKPYMPKELLMKIREIMGNET